MKRLLITSAFVFSCFIFVTAQAQVVDLTGQWKCVAIPSDASLSLGDNIYYVRQVGNELFWYGEGLSQTPPIWSNVAFGKYDGYVALLRWADVPNGSIMNEGMLAITTPSPDEMVVAYQSGNPDVFGCTHFSRQKTKGSD